MPSYCQLFSFQTCLLTFCFRSVYSLGLVVGLVGSQERVWLAELRERIIGNAGCGTKESVGAVAPGLTSKDCLKGERAAAGKTTGYASEKLDRDCFRMAQKSLQSFEMSLTWFGIQVWKLGGSRSIIQEEHFVPGDKVKEPDSKCHWSKCRSLSCPLTSS